MATGITQRAITLLLGSLALVAAPAHAQPNAPYDGLGGSILGTPVTVSWGANRLDTFVVGTDHHLYHKAWDGTQFQPPAGGYEPLGGFIRDGKALAVTTWGANRLDIVVVSGDRSLYHKAWDGSRWLPSTTGWEPLGGSIHDGSSPAITSWGVNRLDIVVVSGDRSLYHKAWDGSRWLPSNSGWEPLGGSIRDGSSPAITSWGANRLDIVVVSGDRGLYRKAWDGSRWLPSATGWDALGGSIRDGSSPAIVSRGANRLDIFVIGQDQGLYHKEWENGRWLPSLDSFEQLGGGIIDGSSPSAAVWGDNRVSAFVIGTDQALYHKAWDGSRWWAYEDLGPTVAIGSSPAATSWGTGRLDVFVVGSDAKLYHKARDSYWLTNTTTGIVPISGSRKFAVLMCKPSDHPEDLNPRGLSGPIYFRSLFTEKGSGLGGMYDYWRDMSYGAISVAGSQVKGWYTMRETLDELMKLPRAEAVKACVRASGADFDFPGVDFYGIVAVYNVPKVDSGDAGTGMIAFNGATPKAYHLVGFASNLWDIGDGGVTFAAHEIGHTFLGPNHSWSRRPQIEYGDPYDIMSALNVLWNVPTLTLFGASGPSLDAPYRDALGWIPPDRIFSASFVSSQVALAPMEQPNTPGYLMAKIYVFGRTDHYYTVEYHRAIGWDRGLPRDVVLVHEVLPDGHSYLINDDGGPEIVKGQPFVDPVNHVSVLVLGMDANHATIEINVPLSPIR